MKANRIHFRTGLIILSALFICTSASAWFASDKQDKEKTKKEMPAEYQKLTDQLVQAQQSYDQLASQLNQAIEAAKKDLTERKNARTALENEIAASDKAINKLKQINEERYQELEQQQKKLNGIEQILTEKSQRIQELADAVQAEKALLQKEDEINTLKSSIELQNSAVAEMKTKQAEMINELGQEIDLLNQQNAEKSNTIKQLKGKLTRLQKKMDITQQNNNELHFEVQELKAAVATYEKEKTSAIEGVTTSLKEFEKFISESK